MTGTDEFGRELDAQGYERAAGGENVVRPERLAAPGPRAPQPTAPSPMPPQPGQFGQPHPGQPGQPPQGQHQGQMGQPGPAPMGHPQSGQLDPSQLGQPQPGLGQPGQPPMSAQVPGAPMPPPMGAPIPGLPGVPADAPWMAGGGLGYAEAVFGQARGRGQAAPGTVPVHPAGHDAPTTEFFPGALFDAGEPEDYQVPPLSASYPQPGQPSPLPGRPLPHPAQQPPILPSRNPQMPASPVQPQVPPQPMNQGSPIPSSLHNTGTGSHSVPFAAPMPQQQDPDMLDPQPYEPGYDPLGGSLGAGNSGSGSWSAAPPRAAQQPGLGQPGLVQPGLVQPGLGQSGAHEAPAAPRPAVPAQPMPTPEPLPGRAAARENPSRPAAPRQESMAPPRRRVAQAQQEQPQVPGAAQQPDAQFQPQVQAPAQAPAQADVQFQAQAQGQTQTQVQTESPFQPQPQPRPQPQTRSRVQAAPVQAPQPAMPQVAVPSPRLPEHSSQDLPVMPPPAEVSQDAEELVVPWQAVAPAAGAEGFAGQAGPRGAGTRRRPEGEPAPADQAVPEPIPAPQPVLLDAEDCEDEYDLAYEGGDVESVDEVEYLEEDEPEAPEQDQPQQVETQQDADSQVDEAVEESSQAAELDEGESQDAEPEVAEARQATPLPQDLAGPSSASSPGRRPSGRTVPQQAGKAAAAQTQNQTQAQPQSQGQAQAQNQAPARNQSQPSKSPQPAATVPQAVQTPQPAAPSAAPRAPQSATGRRPARSKSEAPQAQPATTTPADTADRAPRYAEDALEAVYRVIHERRDIRNDFLADEVPTEVLTRILEAAHTAPSVGFSQPWDFLVLRDVERRRAVHDLAGRQRQAYAASLPKARAKAFAALKIEAILDTPVNIVVTCDPTRGGRHTLGRYTQPMMAPFSTCLAVENLWLAARAEGLGVGWVSFFDERELAETLGLPAHLQIVAYLCLGYVRRFPGEPELAGAGWARRRPLAWAVHEEDFGHRALPGGEPVSLLDATVDAVRGLDEDAVSAARERQNRMTKPPGSLGMLEVVAEQLAGLSGQCPPPMPEPAALAVFAADHGVHAQGVTPWPQEVTAQMVSNFLSGGAVVNAFAKQVGAEVCVVDVGVATHLGDAAGLVPRKVRLGTADMTQGPAMSRAEAVAAIEAGIETARDLVSAGNRCLLTGDMGIANTTASAALIAAFTGASPAQVTGYGTGIDEQTYAHKVEIVRRALALHRPDPQDPVGVLAAFGGLEHAALAGFILGGAALRVPVILDGVIAGAAALVAQAITPESVAACVAGHRSAEPGHALALEQLGVHPLIDLELRLGEGSGAVLALPLVAAAVRALREVATFDSAGVADATASVVVPVDRDHR